MKKKLIFLLVALMLVSLTLAGCGGGGSTDPDPDPDNGEPAVDPMRIGIVYSTGGLGDKSFNDSAHRGLQRAKSELGIVFEYAEPNDSSEDPDFLRDYAEKGLDLVIAVGFQMAESLEIVAQEYPHINFAIVDSVVELDNVKSLIFAEPQGSFLVGALAALTSETGKLGFIGGVDFPLIQGFEGGFIAGAKYINEDIQFLTQYAESFGNPNLGKEIALNQIDQGADVIYHASGGTGQGLFEAVREASADGKTVYAIGVDSNQNFEAPGNIIASMLKRVDVAVFEATKSVVDGNFDGGSITRFDLSIDGVGITDLTDVDVDEKAAAESGDITADELEIIKQLKQNVTAQHADKIAEIKAGILSGEIEVPDWSLEGRP